LHPSIIFPTIKYEPAATNITANYNIYAPVDVAVKNGFVYIADPYHSTSHRLERLHVGFSSGETPDTLLNDPQDGEDTFLGPYYFIHSLSDGLYIVDEPIAGTLDDGRIVSGVRIDKDGCA
jgi:hypothetical protein